MSTFTPPENDRRMRRRISTVPLRLNVGCGEWPIAGFVNIDADPALHVDLVASVPPIPYPDGSVDEVFACHFLEHLSFDDGAAFLHECYRVLRPGGTVGIVVPDMRWLMTEYVKGSGRVFEEPNSGGRTRYARDLDDLNAMFVFSTVQSSHHQWGYDLSTLSRALESAGFPLLREIDRFRDPRLGTGQPYQCGLEGLKPE